MTEYEMNALKDIYDEIDSERERLECENELMKSDLDFMSSLLDSLGVPAGSNGHPLSLKERGCLLRKFTRNAEGPWSFCAR